MKWSALFSIERQYHFYRQYHTNSTNKRIHYVFVPFLIITAMVMLSEVSFPLVDLSNIIAALYIIHGLVLDPAIGTSHAPVILIYLLASRGFRALVTLDTFLWALLIHIVSWVFQFFGHYVFEKRAPALTDSFIQAAFAAPIVLWMDLLFSFGLFTDTKARIARSRAAAKARKAQAQSMNSTS